MAPYSGASSPSAACSIGSFRPGVQARSWTRSRIRGRTASLRCMTAPARMRISGSYAWMRVTASVAQTSAAPLEHLGCDGVAGFVVAEQGAVVDPLLRGERAVGEAGPVGADRRQGPRRGLRLGAAASSTAAGTAVDADGDMAADHPRLVVAAGEQATADHRRAADAGAERDHRDVLVATGGAGPVLAEQRQASIVLEPERKAEGAPAPPGEIKLARVLELPPRRGDDPAATRVDDPAEGERDAGAVGRREAGRVEQGPHSDLDRLERRREPGADSLDELLVDDADTVDQRARGVAPANLDGDPETQPSDPLPRRRPPAVTGQISDGCRNLLAYSSTTPGSRLGSVTKPYRRRIRPYWARGKFVSQ
jgi:hypothetical protein